MVCLYTMFYSAWSIEKLSCVHYTIVLINFLCVVLILCNYVIVNEKDVYAYVLYGRTENDCVYYSEIGYYIQGLQNKIYVSYICLIFLVYRPSEIAPNCWYT